VEFTNHIWTVRVIGQKKVKLRGLDYVAYKMCQYAVLLIRNVFVSY